MGKLASTALSAVGAYMTGGTSAAFTSLSDKRLKKNIKEHTGAIDTIRALPVYSYQYKAMPGVDEIGVMADELETVMPAAVHAGADGYLMVDYARLVPVLIGAVRELSDQVERLRGA